MGFPGLKQSTEKWKKQSNLSTIEAKLAFKLILIIFYLKNSIKEVYFLFALLSAHKHTFLKSILLLILFLNLVDLFKK